MDPHLEAHYLKAIITMALVFLAISVGSIKTEWVNNVTLKFFHCVFYMAIIYTAMDGLMAGAR